MIDIKVHIRLACRLAGRSLLLCRRVSLGLAPASQHIVVCAALIRIAQRIIGLLHFLEPLLGFTAPAICIGMMLLRQFSIGLLNLLG
ncbi:hypothetical protein D3C80_1794010 [compost metagenome]